MREIASKGQLWLAYLRWAVVTVPFILLLGFASVKLAPTGSQNPWYVQLAKPAQMPEEWMFPLALGAVYALVGMALATIINARGSSLRGPALVLFVVQMAANVIWPTVFFGMHQVEAAMIVTGVAGAFALVTAILFARIRFGAAVLMLPYLAWLGYAGFLLFQIDRLNPNAGSLVPSRSADQILIR